MSRRECLPLLSREVLLGKLCSKYGRNLYQAVAEERKTMSGIAGFLSYGTPVCERFVRNMCAQISHRGPAGTNVCVDEAFGVGVCLSKRELGCNGIEPASNEDGSVLAAVDAWLVNADDLQQMLEAKGHKFRTNADAEIVVHLYEERGIEGLSRLLGPFALSLWDKRRHRLLLARARMGERPLFFAALPGGVAFASELRSLRTAGMPTRMDDDGIRLYFLLKFIPEPYTAFESAKKVGQGGWVLCDSSGKVEQG